MPLIKYISLQTEHSSNNSEANILCLGNFDGVHFAHRAILSEAMKMKNEQIPNAKCGVLCFEKPSGDFLFSNPPKHLTTLEQKLKHFSAEGMDFALIVDFQTIRGLSPEEFIDFLIQQCACVGAICGYNYHFGKGGKGDYILLQKLFSPKPVTVVPPVYKNGDTVSSTRIRSLLESGKVKEANELLTVPFSITAPVLHGKGLGHQMGTPTFNQFPADDLLIPARGVYFTRSIIDNQAYYGLTNIGTHPTVDTNAELNVETHLFDFKGDLYQKEITVEFLDYIRPEQQFENLEALQNQIQKDILFAKTLL
ncbi:MAG: bifunctional riboflavin kinase/FAD synthetase [Clostridia bacterium]|nr:bifunctional riboflavin kinase/FAD synthetase [Clostridia bacterium]